MPNFQLSIQIDNRKARKDYQQSEWEIHFNKLLDEFPKLKIESMTINEIYEWAEKWIQIHSLRCNKCKADKFKTCHKVQLLLNIGEVIN